MALIGGGSLVQDRQSIHEFLVDRKAVNLDSHLRSSRWNISGAGYENRTRVFGLGSRRTTIVLIPQLLRRMKEASVLPLYSTRKYSPLAYMAPQERVEV